MTEVLMGCIGNVARLRDYVQRTAYAEFGAWRPRAGLALTLARLLPDYQGIRTRSHLLRWAGWDIGRDCMIPAVPQIIGATPLDRRLHIGGRVSFGVGILLDCSARVSIADGAAIGHRVQLVTGDHLVGEQWSRLGALSPKPISLGRGVWIGSGAIILPGVTIGEGTIVAAGSVVTKDIPANITVAGVPARKVNDLPSLLLL